MDATTESTEYEDAPPPPGDSEAPSPLPAEPAPALDVHGEPAPAEVEQDILGELGKFDVAAAAHANVIPDLAASVPQDPLNFDASFGLTGAMGRADDRYSAQPAQSNARVHRTLEDLCAAFPRIGTDSDFHLHVERRAPASCRGRPCKGWIENLYSPISMAKFRARYGGGTYLVRMMGTQTNTIDADGNYRARSLGQCEFVIAGEPLFPEDEDEKMGNRNFSVLDGGAAEVEKTRLQLDYRERQEQRARADDMAKRQLELERNRLPDWSLMTDLAERRAAEVREASAEGMAQLRAHADRITKQLDERDAQIVRLRQEKEDQTNELRTKLFEERQAAAAAMSQQETSRIRELKEQHEREVARLERDHRDKLESITTEHARKVSEYTDRWDKERRDLVERHERERNTWRDEATRREQQLTADHRSREDNMRSLYESRIAEADRNAQREIRSVKESYGQMLEHVKNTEGTKAVLAERTAVMQVNLASDRADRAERALEATSHDLEEIRRQQHRSPLETIQESRTLLETLGMRVTGAGESSEDNPQDWRAVISQGIRGLLDKAPAIAQGFGEARETNRAARERAQSVAAQAGAGQPPQQYQPPMMGMPPQPVPQQAQQQQRRAHRAQGGMAPPPGWGPPAPPPPYAAPPPLGSRIGPQPAPPPVRHTSMEQGYSPIQPDIQPAMLDDGSAQSAPVADPYAGYPPTDPAMPQQPAPPPAAPAQQPPALQPPAEPPPQAVQPAAPPPPPEGAPPDDVPVTDEQFEEFRKELEDAIVGRVVPPSMFAEEFIRRAGPEVTTVLLQQLSAEQYLTVVNHMRPRSPILTRDGRKYVGELWAIAGQMLGG